LSNSASTRCGGAKRVEPAASTDALRMGPSGGWWLAVKNLVVPIFCRACRVRLLTEENGFFCPNCWEESPRIARPFCSSCGRPHSGVTGFGTQSNFPCADCREHPPKGIRRIWGAARYDGAVAEAIQLLKFHGRRRLAQPLGQLMVSFAEQELTGEHFDVLTPVPLHRVRRRARGFNQSELLCAIVSAAMGTSMDCSLYRIRPTRAQSLLEDAERLTNLRGAFGVRAGHTFTQKRVLLVDDVITTGSTVVECAAALRRAGACDVAVFAAALAVKR
jgi:ComF family protein